MERLILRVRKLFLFQAREVGLNKSFIGQAGGFQEKLGRGRAVHRKKDLKKSNEAGPGRQAGFGLKVSKQLMI